jgi:putative intracellular protease/amidase
MGDVTNSIGIRYRALASVDAMTTRTRILLALTSHSNLGDTGRTTGFYVSEAAHPWRVFTEAGHRVEVVSVAGGRPPLDGYDEADPDQRAFVDAVDLDHTQRPVDVDPEGIAAIFYVGGHGTMWDFPEETALAALGGSVYAAGGVVAAVCHGPAALLNITLPDGRTLIEGKRLTSFTNAEESAVGLTDVVPFRLQTALEERGAKHVPAADFTANVVVDGRLITGQNPASAQGTAEAVLTALTALTAE